MENLFISQLLPGASWVYKYLGSRVVAHIPIPMSKSITPRNARGSIQIHPEKRDPKRESKKKIQKKKDPKKCPKRFHVCSCCFSQPRYRLPTSLLCRLQLKRRNGFGGSRGPGDDDGRPGSWTALVRLGSRRFASGRLAAARGW